MTERFVIIKEEFFADSPGSTLCVPAIVSSMEAAHEYCETACKAECQELNNGQDVDTPPEGCDETCLPDGFRWDDSYTVEQEDERFQYVVRLWTGDDATIVSGFAIRAVGADEG